MLPAYCKEAKFPSLSTDHFIESRLKIPSNSQKTDPTLSLSTDNAPSDLQSHYDNGVFGNVLKIKFVDQL